MEENRLSFGYIVGAIAAVFTIVVSIQYLLDRFVLEEKVKTESVTIPQLPYSSELSELETQLAAQLELALLTSGCPGIELAEVQAEGELTPAVQSNSGFAGYFLEGRAWLDTGSEVILFRVVGNGKGPAAQANAISMAAAGFGDRAAVNDSVRIFCDGK